MKSVQLFAPGRKFFAAIALASLAACGGGDGGQNKQFTIGGNVAGLAGTLVLQNNGADALTLNASGAFTFSTKIAKGNPYAVTILTQPVGQVCTVAAGSGTATADVTNVTVACVAASYSIGGTVSGLAGTMVLQNNGANNLTVAANGPFTFAGQVTHGAPYSVTILTQPAGQVCSVANGAGTATANVTNVAVTCVSASYTIGGTATGLFGTVVLQNNGGDNLTLTANGPFTFANKLVSGAPYAVTVLSQPVGETCTVANGGGTATANVTNIAVVCLANPPPTYSVGGTASGLNGTVVLQNNAKDNLSVSANGPFTFATKIESGGTYSVTVLGQPSGQVCTVANGSGIVTATVASVTVTCVNIRYLIGGTVSGLTGTLVLQNNGADNLTLTSNGQFAFPTQVTSGATYSVTVKTQPAGQTCTVTNGAGTATANVTNVSVACATATYSIGGSVSGLTGTLVLQNNGADNLTLTSNGQFAFPTQVNNGTTYSVTVKTQPVGRTCIVTNGAGTATANVTTVIIDCATDTYSIGGNAVGMTGTLVLTNNGGDDLTVTSAGAFTFVKKVPSGSAYAVQVKTLPLGQKCTITNGSGTATADVTNVRVECADTPPVTIGGSVSGLSGIMVLQNNGADSLVTSTNGLFTFPTKALTGSTYSVTVATQPMGQYCTVVNGSGTVVAQVTNVGVTCVPTYSIGGTVAGLTGTVVLQNNGGDDVALGRDGPFAFDTRIPSGSPYSVTVRSQPAGQLCTVVNGTGTANNNVANVLVTCGAAYAIGGTVSFSRLDQWVILSNNGTDPKTVNARPGSGGQVPFTFSTLIPSGGTYDVKIVQVSSGAACVLTNGTGKATANVTDVTVTCGISTITPTSVGATVQGLKGTLVLQDGRRSKLTVSSDGTVTFPAKVESGDAYAVSVEAQPAGQTCVLTNGTGVVGDHGTQPQVICTDNVSDPIAGTYEIQGASGPAYLTLFADGVYILASASNDAACGQNAGNGVEYGVYNYSSITGAFTIVTAAADTNGSCGLWNMGPGANSSGVLQATGMGPKRVLTLTVSGGPQVVMTPVASVQGSIVGSFGPRTEQAFVVFSPGGEYLRADTQGNVTSGWSAGIVYGCYAADAAASNTVTTDPTASCLLPGKAVLPSSKTGRGVSHGHEPVSYSLADPNTIHAQGTSAYSGSRIIPR